LNFFLSMVTKIFASNNYGGVEIFFSNTN